MNWNVSTGIWPAQPARGKSKGVRVEPGASRPFGGPLAPGDRETSPLASHSRQSLAPDDPRVVAALEDYLDALRGGRACSREEFLAQHSEISEALGECLSGLEFIQTAAVQLEQSNPLSCGDPAGAIPPSARLGDYRILREIGRGGMGVVYEAEQVSLGRHVALKVLPFAAAIDPKQRQRFQIEAQAAAQLHHPHIVPIFSVGCDHGIHYYAMQYVEGHSLAAVLQELRQGDDSPERATGPQAAPRGQQSTEKAPSASKNGTHQVSSCAAAPDHNTPNTVRLSLSSSDTDVVSHTSPRSGSQVLAPAVTRPPHQDRAFCRNIARLGAQAADALEHAHSLGILHRDIKPANLLIDPHGALWITDFGLARFPSDLSLTHTGDMVGTLRYMSPEQALARRGVVDQRTDVYALGVTLYELLTLRPAFDGHDHQELLRQIALDEPIRPHRLNPAVPRDLETIVLKAMAKDPSARYATAQELAADLGRFIDDQPIHARRPGVLERALRWARRRKELVATAAAIVLLALTIGTVAIGIQIRKTEESLRRHEAFVIGSYPLLDRLGMGAIRNAMQQLETQPGTPVAAEVSQTIEQALKIFQEAIELPPTDPVSRAVIGRAYSRLGSIHWLLSLSKLTPDGKPDPKLLSEALENHRRARRLLEELLADSHGDPTIRRYMADALGLGALGCAYVSAGKYDEAEKVYLRAIEIRRELLRGTGSPPSGPPTTITTAEFEDFSNLVNTVSVVRGLLYRKGLVAQAEAMRRQLDDDVIAITARFSAPEFRELRRMWAMQFMQLTNQPPSEQESGRRQAMSNYRLALNVDSDNAQAFNNLAWALSSVPSDPWFDPAQGLELARKAVAQEPATWAYLNTLGIAAFRTGDWETATRVLQQSVALTGGTGHDFFFLAMCHWHQGRKREARDIFDRAVAWTEKNLPKDPELRRFRTEAAQLLGKPCPKFDEPAPAKKDEKCPEETTRTTKA